jgi:outer membrane receptor for ferric coprogen and ferric-rhodotorulic acid
VSTKLVAIQIKDQNLLNVRDALTQTTGINITGGSKATIYSRGFVLSNFQYDGGAPSLYYANYDRGSLPDLSVFDQVEVLRGADGLFSGAGESSGTVNLVRKRPLGYQQALINLSAGSWDHYRQQVDISSPLNSTGSIRGRMVAIHEQQDYFYDTADSNRNLVYGIIEADLNNKTTLAAGITYDDLDSSENYWGLPRYADGRDIGYSRKTNLQTDWTNQNTKRTQIFAELNHQLNEDWQLKLNSSWQETQNNNKIGYSFAAINPLTGQSNYFEMSKQKTKPIEILIDTSISGKFDLFGHCEINSYLDTHSYLSWTL